MRARAALLLLILCAVPFVDLGRRVLWPPDEGRYAVIVREMVASGDFVVPTWAGKPNIDKPPLFMWAGAAASRLMGGVNETAVRLPSAVAAGIFVLATFWLGLRLFDPATALIGAIVLGTCGRFVLYAQWCATDMTVASLMALALAIFVAGGGAPAGSGRRPSIAVAGLLAASISALAVLTKGPVGLVLPAGIVGCDVVAAFRREPGKVISVLVRLLPLTIAGGVVFLAITAPWFVLLEARLGAAGLREILLHQNVSRFLDAWNAQQPWYFYLEMFPLDFLPWIVFLPLAFLPIRRLDAGRLEAWRFLRIWFVLVFIFFSTASGKSPEYLMPLLPAAALMVARILVLAAGPEVKARTEGRWLHKSAVAAASIPALLGLAGFILLLTGRVDPLPGYRGSLLAAAAILAAGSAGSFIALKAGRAGAGALILGAAVLVVKVFPGGSLMDAGNLLNNAPQAAAELARVLPPGSNVGVGRKGADYILYYAAIPVKPLGRPGSIVAFLEEGPPNAVILKGRDYLDMAGRLSGISDVAARIGDGERGYFVLRARARAR